MSEYRHKETGEVKNQGEWRTYYKNTSLPRTWTTETLSGLNLEAVLEAPKPSIGPYETTARNGVEQDSLGNWVTAWIVRDMFADTTDEDGVTTTKAEHEAAFEEDKLNRKRQGMSCSKMQGILTLGETAWGEVQTYRETASWAEQMVIDSAQDWNRTSQNIAFFGWLLNYTDAQMDAMFTAAAQVTA
jgi:hypothetical protein